MTWLTVPQLDGIPGLPTSRVRRREWLERNGTPHRARAGRGGGFEYLVTALPPEAQAALAVRGAGAVRPLATAINAGQQHARAAQVQACATSMARHGVALQSTGALDPLRNPKLDVLQRFEGYHLGRGGAVWPAVLEFCALWQVGQIDAHPSTLGAHPTLQAKTLDKWIRAWRTQGVEALLERKTRSDKGKTALVSDAELHEVFVSALVTLHNPTARQVHRVMVHHLGDVRTPAAGTLKRWLREYKQSNQVALLKLKNPDGWRNKYMPAFGSRSEHITAPNTEWQLDSTIADAQQRVEIAFNLVDGDTGEIRRHALAAVIEVFTRRAKVLVSRTSSANAVKAVTRSAVLAWGLPERVKTDNGKDYTAQDYDFALDALRIDHILCTPFSPDQKPFIERFLGTLLHDLFPMLDGFVGHDVATRKAIESGRSFAQRFGVNGVDLHMSPEQLQGVINGWLDEYHNRVHSELGCTPNEMTERHTQSVTRVDERALDLLLMPIADKGMRVVGKRGISLGNAYFAAAELAGVMGQQVYCRQDEADLGALHVFAMDGTYICRALDHTRLGINRAELAAKARAIEAATVNPVVAEFRKARKKGLVRQAVHAIYAEREQQAVDTSSNVARLPVREVQHITPAVQSLLDNAPTQQAQQSARDEARAQFDDDAPVMRLDTPKQRYSAWVRMQARMAAGEALAMRDADWSRSYASSAEFEAWHQMHEGVDPLAHVAGG